MVQVIKTFHPGYSIKSFYAAFHCRRIVGSGLRGSYFHDIEWGFIISWTTIGDTGFHIIGSFQISLIILLLI